VLVRHHDDVASTRHAAMRSPHQDARAPVHQIRLPHGLVNLRPRIDRKLFTATAAQCNSFVDEDQVQLDGMATRLPSSQLTARPI